MCVYDFIVSGLHAINIYSCFNTFFVLKSMIVNHITCSNNQIRIKLSFKTEHLYSFIARQSIVVCLQTGYKLSLLEVAYITYSTHSRSSIQQNVH